MVEPITALVVSFKILKAIIAVVDGLDEVRDQGRALKYLGVNATEFLELVNRGLQTEDAAPFVNTIQSLEILLRDIFSTAQEYRQMTTPLKLLRANQTKKKLIFLEKRLSTFRDTYLIQSATELRISLTELKRSPSSFGAIQQDNMITDDIRWETMTARSGSTVGHGDPVLAWLDTLRDRNWEAETVFDGNSVSDTTMETLLETAGAESMQNKKWSPVPCLPAARPVSPDSQIKPIRPAGRGPTRRLVDSQHHTESEHNDFISVFIVIPLILIFLAFQEWTSPPDPLPAIEVKPSCLSMVAFQAHDKPAADIAEVNMGQLITASRKYQKGCESLNMKDKTTFSGVSDAINMVNKVLISVPHHAKTGLRRNLAIMYTCRASALLSSGDTSKISEALRDTESAEKHDPSLNLVYWYQAASHYRKGRLSKAQDIIANALRRVDLKDDGFLVDKLITIYTGSKGPPAKLAPFRSWLQEITQRNKRSKSRLKGIQGEWKRYIDHELEKMIKTTFDESLRLEGVDTRQAKLQLLAKAIDGMAELLLRQDWNSPNRTRLSVTFAKMYNHRAELWLTHSDAFSAEAALRDSELAEKYNAGSVSPYISQAVALNRLGRLSNAKDVLARALKRTDLQDNEQLVDLLTRLYNPDSKVDLEDDNAFRVWWTEITVKDRRSAKRLRGIKGRWKARADARLGVQRQGFW